MDWKNYKELCDRLSIKRESRVTLRHHIEAIALVIIPRGKAVELGN